MTKREEFMMRRECQAMNNRMRTSKGPASVIIYLDLRSLRLRGEGRINNKIVKVLKRYCKSLRNSLI